MFYDGELIERFMGFFGAQYSHVSLEQQRLPMVKEEYFPKQNPQTLKSQKSEQEEILQLQRSVSLSHSQNLGRKSSQPLKSPVVSTLRESSLQKPDFPSTKPPKPPVVSTLQQSSLQKPVFSSTQPPKTLVESQVWQRFSSLSHIQDQGKKSKRPPKTSAESQVRQRIIVPKIPIKRPQKEPESVSFTGQRTVEPQREAYGRPQTLLSPLSNFPHSKQTQNLRSEEPSQLRQPQRFSLFQGPSDAAEEASLRASRQAQASIFARMNEDVRERQDSSMRRVAATATGGGFEQSRHRPQTIPPPPSTPQNLVSASTGGTNNNPFLRGRQSQSVVRAAPSGDDGEELKKVQDENKSLREITMQLALDKKELENFKQQYVDAYHRVKAESAMIIAEQDRKIRVAERDLQAAELDKQISILETQVEERAASARRCEELRRELDVARGDLENEDDVEMAED